MIEAYVHVTISLVNYILQYVNGNADSKYKLSIQQKVTVALPRKLYVRPFKTGAILTGTY